MFTAARFALLRQSAISRSSPTTSLLRTTVKRYAASATKQSSEPSSGVWWNTIRALAHVHPPQDSAPRSLEKEWESRSKDALHDLDRAPPANPYSGRSVQVKSGEVGEAYKRLEGILGRNKVRAQLRLAERHEKPGSKRRRLSSERWRKQFANEVRKKVQLVMKIRNRGA